VSRGVDAVVVVSEAFPMLVIAAQIAAPFLSN
jgi:preprotein translocase subunit Sec61beta